MFACSKCFKRYDHRQHKRDIRHKIELPEIRRAANENRERAYEKKYGTGSGNIPLLTQTDHLHRYFKMEA